MTIPEQQEELVELMRQATFDCVIACPRCCSTMEPDAPSCPYCHWKNSLRTQGFI